MSNLDLLKKQKELFDLFNDDFYHKSDIAEILNVSYRKVDGLVKKLKWHPGKGYSKLDIVIQLMDGVLIAK